MTNIDLQVHSISTSGQEIKAAPSNSVYQVARMNELQVSNAALWKENKALVEEAEGLREALMYTQDQLRALHTELRAAIDETRSILDESIVDAFAAEQLMNKQLIAKDAIIDALTFERDVYRRNMARPWYKKILYGF